MSMSYAKEVLQNEVSKIDKQIETLKKQKQELVNEIGEKQVQKEHTTNTQQLLNE